MKTAAIASFTALLFLFGSCKNSTPVSPALSGVVYMWIAPAADTKIDSDQPDMNFSDAGDNTIARYHIPGTQAWHVTSYVKFLLPQLPPDTKVDEAYFELYHSGTTEDGTPDNTRFMVSPVGVWWNAKTVTWNNGPDRGTVTSGVNPIGVILHSNDWCGTPNIADTLVHWMADTSWNTGFRVTLSDPQNWYKSFYSNNSFIGANNKDGRTDSTVGRAPRLLMKIELPQGKTTKDIIFPQLPPDMDIKLGPYTAAHGIVWMADYATGVDWPQSWNVKKGQ